MLYNFKKGDKNNYYLLFINFLLNIIKKNFIFMKKIIKILYIYLI
jgi:hypothetical protein